MKKVLALLGVVMFSASAFALNVEAPSGKDCAGEKAAFEKYAVDQRNEVVAQHIIINMADPMENMTDEQALPIAACYATFKVKGTAFTNFVRAHAGIFPGDITGKEEAEMRAFAARVDRLSAQDKVNKIAQAGNVSHTIEYILINFADPMAKMSDVEAVPLAKAYAGVKVNGQPMVEFVRVHASEFAGNVPYELDTFVERVNKLAK